MLVGSDRPRNRINEWSQCMTSDTYVQEDTTSSSGITGTWTCWTTTSPHSRYAGARGRMTTPAGSSAGTSWGDSWSHGGLLAGQAGGQGPRSPGPAPESPPRRPRTGSSRPRPSTIHPNNLPAYSFFPSLLPLYIYGFTCAC